MHGRQNYLFQGDHSFAVAEAIKSRAMAQLKAFHENNILSTPLEDLVSHVVDEHSADVPRLLDADTWMEEREVTAEVQRRSYDPFSDRFGGVQSVRQHVIYFHIPFEGDRNFFNVGPSRSSIPGPIADVVEQEVVLVVATDGRSQEEVKLEYTNRLTSIQGHLNTLRSDFGGLRTAVEAAARPYLQERKAQLLRGKNLAAAMGFPMKRRLDAPTTYRAPEVRRKLTPAKPSTVAPFKPEPAIEEAEYQNILGVMDNMTTVMERSPHTFKNMGEEDIRQHFLVQLNGQYEGGASGETFNFHGKTDILIRSEGRNIFIAECKFWKGEKGFTETVDQLLSYLTWRDSKTAVIVFNKNKNLSGVLEAIKRAMEAYPHKKRGPVVQGDTRLRYVMGSPQDHNREITMTVMVYDIPK